MDKLNLEDIIEMRSRKISLREIAKKYHTNHHVIGKFLTKHNESTVMFRRQFDKEFFNTIDTEEKAYFLGIMLSDGFVQEGRIAINMTDMDVLEKFKECVKYDGNIRKILPEKNIIK